MTWKPPSDSIRPHPENAPGPFYVEDGCCITCGVPLVEAPANFGWTEGELVSCVVKQQPRSAAELEQVIEAMQVGEVQCIRYRGDDPGIARRIVEAGFGECLDNPPPSDARRIVHDRVTFRVPEPANPAEWARRFAEHLKAGTRYEVRRRGRAAVSFSWFAKAFHRVDFRTGREAGAMLAVCLPAIDGGMRAVTRTLATWLETEPQCREACWYTRDDWNAGRPGRAELV